MKTILNVVSYTRKIYSGNFYKINVFGIDGALNIYPGHSSLLTLIQPGLLFIHTICKKEYFYISSGILEIQPNLIHILSEEVIPSNCLNYNDLIKEKNILLKEKSHFNNHDIKKKIMIVSAKLNIIRFTT
ncbi:ATP synthase F1 subunit epsilon [Buchnera aphidicola]|uniref:ATP synthase F1 subunit epsilon n=1 Tax=Buchnera aphidicola TaxID=9 RepID=UPI0031B88430